MAEQRVEAARTAEQHIKMSYDEWLTAFEDSTHTEWVNGEAITFMPPKTIHQQIADFLSRLMGLYAELLHLGTVISAPFEMRIRAGGNVRGPDLLFIAHEHLERLTPDRLASPADLVVEILSEDSARRDRSDKFYEYQGGGVREYLIVDPRPGKERLDWYALQEDGRYQALLPDGQGRYRSAALPRFWLRAGWLREGHIPDPLLALAEIRGLSPEAAQALREMLLGAV
ncbi:MAG TPA: Uma2 family endonuclease [Roseiflexaceae bacterium]|nr:Uma2 family endonuclease [Roseiflexaceae bacterium]